jgi:aerobic carbon-monoxide dehydrogenase large subunit
MMGEFALGQAVPRFEDPRLLRGGGRYLDDVVLPNMAHGYVLRSPHAHAKILSIDVSAAREAAGVLLVLTAHEWAASGYGDLPTAKGRKKRDGTPMYQPAFPALVGDYVRYVGDPIAFVVASTLAQAIEAAELIEIEFEPLPAVTSTAQALAVDAPIVWEKNGDNICFVHTEGNKAGVDEAFARADHISHLHLVITRVTAATMETRGTVADYDFAADRYTIYTPLQRALAYRAEIATTLRVPESKIRVIGGDVGGSFGMKSGVFNEAGFVCLASKMLRRPVKWVSTRSESFLCDAHGRDNVTDVSLALDKDGHFLGMRVKTIASVGSYTQPGSESGPVGNLGTLAGVYTIPAIDVDVTAVFSHTNPMRPYRGNGRPEAAYVIERIIDHAADEMGIDPVELRRRNLIPPDAMPYQTALSFKLDCGEFEKNMNLALDMADYKGFEARRAEARGRGKLRGIGVSNSIERAAAPGFEGAEIRFDRSGTATIIMGSCAQGQGHETSFKQLVCDSLGLRPSDVHYIQGDTDQVFFGEGTGGSRTSAIGGSALRVATDKVIDKARKIAAHVMKVDDLDFHEGIFTSRSTNRTLSVQEIAKASLDPKNVPEGVELGLNVSAVYNAKVQNYPNGTHVCELEIDEETGQVQLVGYTVVDDVGNVINPLILKGQIYGGVAQGVGQILMEEIRFDPHSGQNLSGSFMDYAMPHAEVFPYINVKSSPVPTATNLLGTKGAGEAGCVGAMPAVANALVDALSVYGVRHIAMPATSERIWRAIAEAKARH